MAAKFELLASLALFATKSALVRAQDDIDFGWTDDFTTCNMYRLIEQECPEDNKGNGKRYDVIPAT